MAFVNSVNRSAKAMIVSRPAANGTDTRPAPASPAHAPPAIALAVDPSALQPLVRAIVAEVLAQIATDKAALPEGRLCWSESEAAALLGLHVHQLRDERRRGAIGASSIVGKRIRYLRADLENYLAARRVNGE
jgi:hypothetical protein